MIVFDVIVHGEVKETIHPISQRLHAMLAQVTEEARRLSKVYGTPVQVNRRIIY
ncbi:mechanosensitive ion channel protein MscL [Paenibacillus sp. KQZ6P-2]|uniref:Mechanosensitive ion channel protein MscL n=1 Tax=Paenibacillus mangrovi TaxID=2931978 RepID=A0A9X2B475_9BACL|nr:mechanosensitive ion channel protein MscL [Paenibacillus mangrovi]MCJ8011327.1 mechanosensitive ion channel protein MscL [Paenibacillus mangrovi]